MNSFTLLKFKKKKEKKNENIYSCGILGKKQFLADPPKCLFMLISEKTTGWFELCLRQERIIHESDDYKKYRS